MPNVIGRNLQAAPNAIQALGNDEGLHSGSTELTGECRNQLMEANLQVCTSTPPPGATMS